MRNFVQGILATLVVLALGGCLYLRLGYADLRAKAQPSWLESELAVTAWMRLQHATRLGNRTRSLRLKQTCLMARVFIGTSVRTVTAGPITP
jgi:hypothetical protein